MVIFLFFAFLRNRVVATLTERITAENPPYGEQDTLRTAVNADCFNRICRAGRSKTAAGYFAGGNIFLIKPDQLNQEYTNRIHYHTKSQQSSVAF